MGDFEQHDFYVVLLAPPLGGVMLFESTRSLLVSFGIAITRNAERILMHDAA